MEPKATADRLLHDTETLDRAISRLGEFGTGKRPPHFLHQRIVATLHPAQACLRGRVRTGGRTGRVHGECGKQHHTLFVRLAAVLRVMLTFAVSTGKPGKEPLCSRKSSRFITKVRKHRW